MPEYIRPREVKVFTEKEETGRERKVTATRGGPTQPDFWTLEYEQPDGLRKTDRIHGNHTIVGIKMQNMMDDDHRRDFIQARAREDRPSSLCNSTATSRSATWTRSSTKVTMSRISRLREYSNPANGQPGPGRDPKNIEYWSKRASANSQIALRASNGPMKLPSTKVTVRDTSMKPKIARNLDRLMKGKDDPNMVGDSDYMRSVRRI